MRSCSSKSKNPIEVEKNQNVDGLSGLSRRLSAWPGTKCFSFCFAVTVFVFLYLVAPLAAFGAKMQMATPKKNASHWTYYLGHWNDNSAFDDIMHQLFPNKISRSPDDHVTASLWVAGYPTGNLDKWEFNIFYHIITEKRSFFRVDLLALAVNRRIKFGRFECRVGAQLLALGNIGGAKIQSTVHKWLGFYQLSLPYLTRTLYAVGGHFSAMLQVYASACGSARLLAGTRQNSAILSGKQYIGASFESPFIHAYANVRLKGELFGGLADYNPVLQWSSHIFKRSPLLGFRLTGQRGDLFSASFWIMGGQYGQLKDLQYGLAFGLGNLSRNAFSLSRILFP